MKLHHDRATGILITSLRDTAIRESNELRPDVIADHAADGEIVRLEILDALRRVDDPAVVELATAVSQAETAIRSCGQRSALRSQHRTGAPMSHYGLAS